MSDGFSVVAPQNKPTAYVAKPGSHLAVPAQVVGEEMEYLVGKYGMVLPDVMVERARPTDAPLHVGFTWDDKQAAQERRVDQARYMIRSIMVQPAKGLEWSAEPVRAFVNVKVENTNFYTSLQTVMGSVSLRKQLLAQAKSDWEAYRRKYGQLKELYKLFDAADGIPDLFTHLDEEEEADDPTNHVLVETTTR